MSSIKDFELAQRIHIATVQLQSEIVTLRNAAVVATERAETSDAAWKILCGGKQKIIDALQADLAAAREHNIRLIEAINRLHEIAQGMWDGSESEIADIVNSALAGKDAT